ncbi:hypothetical protein Tco_1318943 [Tanacetum coccineum]
MAKRAQPVLYDADTLLHPTHHPVSIWDSEEVLVHQVVSMKKMNEKPGHVRPENGFYDKLNALKFVPQQELSREQAYWLPANERASQTSNPNSPVTPFIHKSRPPSQVLASLRNVNAVFPQFEGIIKERTTQKPDYVSEWCFDYAKQFVEQQLVPFYDHFKKHIQAANDTFFKEIREFEQIFDELDEELLLQYICSIVLSSDIVVPPSSNCLCEDLRSACDREHTKVLELEAEVLKQQKMVIESEKQTRAADHNRKLNIVYHNQFVIRSLKSVNTKTPHAKHSVNHTKKVWKATRNHNVNTTKDSLETNWEKDCWLCFKPQWKTHVTNILRCMIMYFKLDSGEIKTIVEPLELTPSVSSSSKVTKISRFPDCNLSDRKAGSKGISEIKKVYIQSFRTISENQCLLQMLNVMEIRRRYIIKAFKDSNRYEHVRLKISVWQSQSERRSQSNSEKCLKIDYQDKQVKYPINLGNVLQTNMFQANHEDAYDSDVDEGPNAAVAFMANLSSTSATNNSVNEVHSNDNQIFDNVDYQLNQEMHQEEHLDSDADCNETEFF